MSCNITEGLRGSSGGIGGSGIFGFFGTVVQCKSDDKTWFCMFSKFMNVLIMLMILLYILSFVYDYGTRIFRKKMKGGGGCASNNMMGAFYS